MRKGKWEAIKKRSVKKRNDKNLENVLRLDVIKMIWRPPCVYRDDVGDDVKWRRFKTREADRR